MTAAAVVFGGIAVALLLWSYLFYPWLLFRLSRNAHPTGDEGRSDFAPSVEVIVSAHDEEESIGARVANLLAQQYAGPLAVSIGCDGCRDRTAARAREAGDERVRVVEFAQRRGKASVLNDLVAQARSDVLVFTDANSTFAADAVRRLIAPLADPSVGAVCGRLVLESPEGNRASPETEFWDRETRLKEAEGRLGVCLGANGAIYAARCDLVAPLPEGSALDDFLIPARIAAAGRRVVFAGDAIAREPAGSDVAMEASRRLRIGIGAGGILLRERGLFDFRRRPLLALAFLSRKVARWLAPVAAFGAILLALFSPSLRPFAAALAAALLLLAASVLLRPRVSGWAGRLYYFGVINLALAAGVVAGLAGIRRPAWPRTSR
ncbi:MAG TPA: glycosyltransferase family 2 protein [Thermoanaerobaculia bacterium]|nr:glycosyltransferase family 2 protein [Thermoanaerobaculia bacterium]